MEFTKSPFGWWCNLAVKCVLSCLAVGVFISLLNLMKLWYAGHPPVRTHGYEPSVSDGANYNSRGSAQNNEIFWPQFLGSERSSVHQVTINGVQITSQAWVTTASGRDVIAYYRQQMTARGWRDVTEETIQLRPEYQQDERYLSVHRAALDSGLILNRGGWCMQVTTFPDKEKAAQTTVNICVASTPSLQDFFAQLVSPSGEDTAQGGQPLDVVQQGSDGTYHMMITMKDESPAQAFQDALSDAGAKGWSPAMIPGPQRSSGNFVWLTKGAQYAALSVAASPGGQGSSVTLVEVTPR
jgi:hypothetical protein